MSHQCKNADLCRLSKPEYSYNKEHGTRGICLCHEREQPNKQEETEKENE